MVTGPFFYLFYSVGSWARSVIFLFLDFFYLTERLRTQAHKQGEEQRQRETQALC